MAVEGVKLLLLGQEFLILVVDKFLRSGSCNCLDHQVK